MKDLTIKQKAKAWDNVLSQAKDLYNGMDVDHALLEKLFPELKKDEVSDEKIWNLLINTFKSYAQYDDKFQDIELSTLIEWLENQKARFLNETIIVPSDGIVEPVMSPAEEGQSKFKVGDWVVTVTGTVYQIKDITSAYGSDISYQCQSQNGSIFIYPISAAKTWHLWTIEDACECDILASDETIVMFKELDMLNIRCFCTYHFLNMEKFNLETLQNKTAYHPATTDQVRLLFRKIFQFGYEWLPGNKKFRKLKARKDDVAEELGIDGLWHAIVILQKTLGKVDGYQTDDGIEAHKCAINAIQKIYTE